jgi:hypothetical protein
MNIWRSPTNKNGSLVFVSNSVSEYCDCKVWLSGKGTPAESIAFFGHEEDTLLALFLMDSFKAAMVRSGQNIAARWARSWTRRLVARRLWYPPRSGRRSRSSMMVRVSGPRARDEGRPQHPG